MTKRFGTALGLCLLACAVGAHAQATFAVAAIRPSGQQVKFEADGRTTTSPGHLLMKDVTVATCLKWAYGVQQSQIVGPPWLTAEHFDIDAKADDPVDIPQLKMMLQALLSERFKLTFHHEKKELKSFVMTVAKSGLKMRPSASDGVHSWQNSANGTIATGIPMREFADYMAGPMEAPIVDETGLDGKYDFTLDFTNYLAADDRVMHREMTGVLIAAMQGELGIKLEGRKSMVEVLVIDHADRPSENESRGSCDNRIMQLAASIPLTEAEIDTLVETFYAKVRDNATIGPIFNAEVQDWPTHLALLKSFWASVMLGAGTFRGNPMEKHMMLPLQPEHFRVWLALFRETAHKVLRPAGADMVIRRAERIAENFQSAIASARS